MGNSPTDKGRDFINSGMTLITERSADKWLKMVEKRNRQKKSVDFTERFGDK